MPTLETQLEVLLERIAALEAEVLRLNEELRRRLGLNRSTTIRITSATLAVAPLILFLVSLPAHKFYWHMAPPKRLRMWW